MDYRRKIVGRGLCQAKIYIGEEIHEGGAAHMEDIAVERASYKALVDTLYAFRELPPVLQAYKLKGRLLTEGTSYLRELSLKVRVFVSSLEGSGAYREYCCGTSQV